MQQIFYNAKVHTFVESGFEADAFLVNDGSIVLVGSKDEVFELKRDDVKLIDLKGKEVYPAFFSIDTSIYSMIESNLRKSKKEKNLEDNTEVDENYEKFNNFEIYKKEFLKIQKQFLNVGITTIQELYVTGKEFVFWKKLSEANLLELDVIAYIDIKNAKEVMDNNCRTYRKYKNHFRLGGYSLAIDGNILDIKAWLKKPYKHEGGYVGFSEYYDEQLSFLIKTALEEKKQLVVETNGDKAVEQFLRVFEEVVKKEKVEDNFKPIALKCNILNKKQLLKMQELQISPSFQFDDLISHKKELRKMLGRVRTSKLKPIAVLKNQNMTFLLQSERNEIVAPFELAKSISTENVSVLSNKQKIGFDDALKVLILNSAKSLFDQEQKGTIENGKNATFVLVEDNKVLETYIMGEKK